MGIVQKYLILKSSEMTILSLFNLIAPGLGIAMPALLEMLAVISADK